VTDSGLPDWAPDLDEVGALLRARTKDDVGQELGTFTEATRPTDENVLELIRQACDDVLGLFTVEDVPASSQTMCRRAAALRTALSIEISYFPEQGNDNSPYLQLRQISDAAIQQVIKRAVWLDAFDEDPLPEPRR
jgi:hypothetical protein